MPLQRTFASSRKTGQNERIQAVMAALLRQGVVTSRPRRHGANIVGGGTQVPGSSLAVRALAIPRGLDRDVIGSSFPVFV